MTKYNLEKILPHKNPMILIDDIKEVNIDEGTLTAIYKPTPQKLFYDKCGNGVSAVIGIELMAQTIGCYAYFRNGEKEPQIGFLLGTRLFEISIDFFKTGEIYEITVKEIFTDNNISSFDCLIHNKDNKEISSATINVYQNDDLKSMGVK